MGQGELRCADAKIIVEQDIDINYPVVIRPVHTLLRAPHTPLYGCGTLQHLLRCEQCGAAHGGIDKGVL